MFEAFSVAIEGGCGPDSSKELVELTGFNCKGFRKALKVRCVHFDADLDIVLVVKGLLWDRQTD